MTDIRGMDKKKKEKSNKIKLTDKDIEEANKPTEKSTVHLLNLPELKSQIEEIKKISLNKDLKEDRDKIIKLQKEFDIKYSNEKKNLTESEKKKMEEEKSILNKSKLLFERKISSLLTGKLKTFDFMYPAIFGKIIFPIEKEDEKRFNSMLESIVQIQSGRANIEDVEKKLGEKLYKKYVEPKVGDNKNITTNTKTDKETIPSDNKNENLDSTSNSNTKKRKEKSKKLSVATPTKSLAEKIAESIF